MTEHLEEFMRDKMDDRDALQEQLSNSALEAIDRSKLMEQIENIDKFLGTIKATGSGDPLADYWEAQIDAGEDPDWDMTMEDLNG